MALYDRIADLPLSIAASDRRRNERDTSSGFRRVTTTIALSGEGATGRGEDVTYDAEDHDALAEAPPLVGDDGLAPGEYTFDEFSAALEDVDLFPTKAPESEPARHYRRWAVESAGVDLALRQADRSLGDVLDRSYDPVRFVVSTRLDGDAGRRGRKLDHTEENWFERRVRRPREDVAHDPGHRDDQQVQTDDETVAAKRSTHASPSGVIRLAFFVPAPSSVNVRKGPALSRAGRHRVAHVRHRDRPRLRRAVTSYWCGLDCSSLIGSTDHLLSVTAG